MSYTAQYISTAQIKAFIGPDCNDANAQLLLETSEALFNQLVGSPNGLKTGTRTDYFDAKEFRTGAMGRIFYLKQYNPTTITSVNDIAVGTVNVDFILDGRKLEFKEGYDMPSAFPYRYKVIYTGGIIGDIPGDIQEACLMIAKGFFDKKTAGDIASFRQDLLSVNYKTDKGMIDSIL